MARTNDNGWHTYTDPAKALEVWDAAVKKLGAEEALKLLDMSDGAPRQWKAGRAEQLTPRSARKVRRLALRIGVKEKAR